MVDTWVYWVAMGVLLTPLGWIFKIAMDTRTEVQSAQKAVSDVREELKTDLYAAKENVHTKMDTEQTKDLIDLKLAPIYKSLNHLTSTLEKNTTAVEELTRAFYEQRGR